MGIAQAAAWQANGGARASFANCHVCATNADARADAAFAEVQANAGEDSDRTAEPEAHGVIIRV
jgi:hypothetical protein